MHRRCLYVYACLLSVTLLGVGATSGHAQSANPTTREPAQVDSSYQFEPPPPPPDDSSDFSPPDDSMQTGDDSPQAPPSMPPPPPPPTGMSQYYEPAGFGKLSPNGKDKIHFKLVTGEFWEKGKKRPRGKIQR